MHAQIRERIFFNAINYQDKKIDGMIKHIIDKIRISSNSGHTFGKIQISPEFIWRGGISHFKEENQIWNKLINIISEKYDIDIIQVHEVRCFGEIKPTRKIKWKLRKSK